MKRICFYTSDYGYGHAARDIAIIRGIVEHLGAQVYVKTDVAFEFMRRSLPSAKVIRKRNDLGPIMGEQSAVADTEKTLRMVDTWVTSWDSFIRDEKRFCEDECMDLILSDIVPQAFLIAHDLGIPGVGISNFTWHYIYSNLLGKNESVDRLEEAYRSCDLAIVLPFNEEMRLFKRTEKIGLISRAITRQRSNLRVRHSISENELLVYVGLGRSLGSAFLGRLKDNRLMDKFASGIKFLVSSGVEIPLDNVIQIPEDEIETQDYIAMCDFVVSKAGYSTVSEAIRGRVPLVLFQRDGYEEDKLIIDGIGAMGIGKEISREQFLNMDWIDELYDLKDYRSRYNGLDSRFKDDGLPRAVALMQEALQ